MIVPETLPAEGLILRRHRSADRGPFAAFLTHPTATRYMAFTPEQKTADGARAMLDYVIASYDSAAPIFSLTIVDEGGAYLGSCGAQPLADEDGGIEVYYTVMPEHQGRGVATRAMRAVIDHLFRSTEASRLVAFVVPENVPSVRVAEKLGFVSDGAAERQAATGELSHDRLRGLRYVLSRRPPGG